MSFLLYPIKQAFIITKAVIIMIIAEKAATTNTSILFLPTYTLTVILLLNEYSIDKIFFICLRRDSNPHSFRKHRLRGTRFPTEFHRQEFHLSQLICFSVLLKPSPCDPAQHVFRRSSLLELRRHFSSK